MSLAALTIAASAALCAPGSNQLGATATRLGAVDSAIASSVAVPPAAAVIYVSGIAADPVDSKATAGSVERFGDTETQTRSVLRKIEAALAAQKMALSDVMMMRVYLVAPPGQPRMDFAGMMRAYRERFGTSAQPNKPARATVQVAGLVDPRWLVEIEVTAAKAGKCF